MLATHQARHINHVLLDWLLCASYVKAWHMPGGVCKHLSNLCQGVLELPRFGAILGCPEVQEMAHCCLQSLSSAHLLHERLTFLQAMLVRLFRARMVESGSQMTVLHVQSAHNTRGMLKRPLASIQSAVQVPGRKQYCPGFLPWSMEPCKLSAAAWHIGRVHCHEQQIQDQTVRSTASCELPAKHADLVQSTGSRLALALAARKMAVQCRAASAGDSLAGSRPGLSTTSQMYCPMSLACSSTRPGIQATSSSALVTSPTLAALQCVLLSTTQPIKATALMH